MENRAPDHELLDAKGLASRLGYNVSYVYAMKRRGFRMTAKRTTFALAWAWLEIHGSPRSGEYRKKTEGFGRIQK
jgi:hypothetical protein